MTRGQRVVSAAGLNPAVPGHKPGGALLRHPLRAHPAPDPLPQPELDGGAGLQPRDYRHSHRGLGTLIGALNVFVLSQTYFS